LPHAPRVCVIIPALQAAATVGDVVHGALCHVDRVFVVNDGSWDGTGDVARAAGAEVVDHPINLGKGQALKTGMRFAYRLGYQRAVTLDADGRHDPDDIPAMLTESTDEPLVLGVRAGADLGALRRLARWACGLAAAGAGGALIPDPLCGLRSYPLAATLRLPTRGQRYEYEAEVVVRALWHGLPLVFQSVSERSDPEAPDGSFRLLIDNVRIAALLGSMLVPGRIPALRRRALELDSPPEPDPPGSN
jgi:glycosyltransferase involved in cell wall biosynthesis